jgi:hypothetical protein
MKATRRELLVRPEGPQRKCVCALQTPEGAISSTSFDGQGGVCALAGTTDPRFVYAKGGHTFGLSDLL